jgi:hypothetical protein
MFGEHLILHIFEYALLTTAVGAMAYGFYSGAFFHYRKSHLMHPLYFLSQFCLAVYFAMRLQQDMAESNSFGFYLTLIALVTMVVSLVVLYFQVWNRAFTSDSKS